MKIAKVDALEVLDSRGNPTVMAMVMVEDGTYSESLVPSGASTGIYEALELRDGDESRYLGKGCLTAVRNVREVIAPSLVGHEVTDQAGIDKIMLELDGTETKAKLGANAILAVSMACVKAAAKATGQPLYAYVAELFGRSKDRYILPIPMMNVLNGGKHAIGSSDMQEYMLFPIGATSFKEALRMGVETFQHLGKILVAEGFQTTVGDEGGYAPALENNARPIEVAVEAMKKAGYEPRKDIAIALDPAASEFFDEEKKIYDLKTERRTLSSEEMVALYQEMVAKYPIVSIEDGLAEDDWEGFRLMTERMGASTQIMGDDLFVTNVGRLQRGIEQKAANSILIKLNQIGSVSETIAAIKMAEAAGYTSIVSHRSGETEDSFIADFVVGAGTGQIKTGSCSRSERIAKYNRLLQIEYELGDRAELAKWSR
ncbi:phosphopyruvate hydratase [Microgenomates group bacterium]|nr:phosphopyruvate hydratase [Microgenomates group bacterium]